ncbi:MAG: hypothetical protein R3185_06115 [Candidatus Thermoplasmatota archaeon]|nr:hypothetical protein [Candidatus Thermoplasmatota archaeon]
MHSNAYALGSIVLGLALIYLSMLAPFLAAALAVLLLGTTLIFMASPGRPSAPDPYKRHQR